MSTYESIARIKEKGSHIEAILGTARNLREFSDRLQEMAGYEEVNNDTAQSMSELRSFFREEYLKVGALIDAINGVSTDPSYPQDLAAILAEFPNTPMGEVSQQYGVREQVRILLTKLMVELEGVDVKTE